RLPIAPEQRVGARRLGVAHLGDLPLVLLVGHHLAHVLQCLEVPGEHLALEHRQGLLVEQPAVVAAPEEPRHGVADERLMHGSPQSVARLVICPSRLALIVYMGGSVPSWSGIESWMSVMAMPTVYCTVSV